MYGSGYGVSDGCIVRCDLGDYTNFELYRGQLEGEKKLLQYISWLLKGKIDLSAMSDLQNGIMLDSLKESLRLSEYDNHLKFLWSERDKEGNNSYE
jgi:hypothetical protein